MKEENLSKINADTLNWQFDNENDNICILRYIVNNTLLSSTSVIKQLYNFIMRMIYIRGVITAFLCPKLTDIFCPQITGIAAG